MKTDPEALDMLYASGAPSATFLTIGTKHEGKILAVEKVQQRDMKTKLPKFWENGDPMMQLVFTIQTDERDPELDDDDGQRRIFAKAQMLRAIRDAITVSGFKGDPVGGFLGVKYVADGKAKTAGFNPPKEYKAKFAPPSVNLVDDEDLDDYSVESGSADYADTDTAGYSDEPF